MHCFGADSDASLETRFGDVVKQAHDNNLLTTINTKKGSFTYISYAGRTKLGFRPNHLPPPWIVETHIYRRRAIAQLEAEGFVFEKWYSKTLMQFGKGNLRYIVAAKHDGYTARGVRGLLSRLRIELYEGAFLVVFTPYRNRLEPLNKKYSSLQISQLKH